MKKIILTLLALSFALMAFAQVDITIGTGTSTGRYPLNDYYKYSRSQSLYMESEIGAPGTIHKLRWYRDDTGADPDAIGTTQIWLKTVTNAVLTGTDWEDPGTLVAEISNIDLGAGGGWYEVDITDFAYSGGNLLVSVYTQNAPFTSPHAYWRYTSTTGINTIRSGNSDSSNPPSLSLGTSRPNIQINMTTSDPTSAPNPAVIIAPANGQVVFLDAALSWAGGGGFPSSYDLYFGTTESPAFLQNMSETTYTPTLAYGTTYYWKVVPLNTLGEAAGCPVWSFSTPGVDQLAESFEVSVPPAGWASIGSTSWSRSTSYSTHGSAAAYKYGSTSTSYTLSTPMLTIESGDMLYFDLRISSLTAPLEVVYSTDRENWTLLNSYSVEATNTWRNFSVDLSAAAGNHYIGFRTAQVSASYYIDSVFGPNITPLVPGAPTLTAPIVDATDVNEWTTFTWTAPTTGGIPSGYNIYLDTVDGSTLFASNVSSPYTVSTPLAYNTTYYWTVVATNSAGSGDPATVRSFTTRSNPTISTFPWVEDFGTVSGDWPVANWSQLNGLYGVETPASGTQWYQDDWLNVTTPANKAARINIWGSSMKGWLITPPIAIPATGYELKFDLGLTDYASTNAIEFPDGQADDKFIVLIADNPMMTGATPLRTWDNDASAFVYNEIPNTGTTVILDLDGYVGTYYFAFYGESTVSVTGEDNDLFVDNVTVRETPALPIFSYTPDTIDFGAVMNGVQVGPQNVIITNLGGGTLNITTSDISITGTNATEFSFDDSALPAALGVGQSVQIPVYVTGVTEGAISATLTINYDSVDYDVALSANVLPAGTMIIGNGTANNSIPVNPYYGYTYSQSIFLQSELNMADQRIEKISYYWNGADATEDTNDWIIYMGHTAATEFTSTTDWIPVANLNQVFSGIVAAPAVAGWVEIVLDSPFVYNNTDNLVIAVDENTPSYDGSGMYYYSTASATNRSLRFYSDYTNPDPAAPEAGTLVSAYPNVLLQFGDLPTTPIFSLDPDVTEWNYGDLQIGETASKEFTITNIGGGTLGLTNLVVSGDPEFALATAWGRAVNLTAGQSYSFTVDYSPTAVGTHSGLVSITDDQSRNVTEIALLGTGMDATIATFPYLEDFEAHADNTLPAGWVRSSLATGWEIGSDLSSSYWTIPTHTVYAAANDDAGGSGADGSMDILTMPKIDLSGTTPGVPIFGFDSFYTGEYGQLASIEASTDNITWESIYAVESNADWTTQNIALTDHMGMAEVYLRFHSDDGGDWASGWAIDNVSISYSTEDIFPPTITHYPEIGSLLADTPIQIVAEIADSPVLTSGIASAKLFYSTDASTYTEIAMTNIEDALYAAAIPGQALGTTISYYIEAVDGATTPNTTTTDTWDFEINDPVTLQYDSGTPTTGLGLSSGTFGVMTGFPNPLGAGNYLQINSVSAGMNNAGTANVHVFTYDGEAGVLVDVIPPFSQSFEAGVHLSIPLTNCFTNAGYFYVAFTDVLGPNYFQFDETQDYYPGTHYLFFGAGSDLATLGLVESSGFPGSWLIRANVEPAATSLDTPAVSLAQGSTGVDLSWTAVDGAGTYKVYGSDDPYTAEAWDLVASVTSPAYTYTGTEANKFFKVVAENGLIISRASHTKLDNIRTNHKVRLQEMNMKGKRK